MAKVVLAWNPNPNESAVTLPLIRKTKELLDSRGHAVEVVKVPFSLTLHGQLKARGSVPAMGIEQVLWLEQKFPNAFIFQFHTTPDTSRYWRKQVIHEKPERWSGLLKRRERALSGIVGIGRISRSARMYFIEFPAKYTPAHSNLQRMARGRMTELDEMWFGQYFAHQTSGKASKKAGYLSAAFARAAAEKIDHVISEEASLARQRLLRPKPRKKAPKEKRLQRRRPK